MKKIFLVIVAGIMIFESVRSKEPTEQQKALELIEATKINDKPTLKIGDSGFAEYNDDFFLRSNEAMQADELLNKISKLQEDPGFKDDEQTLELLKTNINNWIKKPQS